MQLLALHPQDSTAVRPGTPVSVLKCRKQYRDPASLSNATSGQDCDRGNHEGHQLRDRKGTHRKGLSGLFRADDSSRALDKIVRQQRPSIIYSAV